MKKNVLFSMMALFVMLFASCSQEEIVSTVEKPTGGQLITISAALPKGANSRSMATVADYKARCILQLVDESGKAIEGQRYVEEVTGDNVTFEFTAPDQTYQCVFWADYVQASAAKLDTDYFYVTDALPAVTLGELNKNVMFGTEAADAFCEVIENPASGMNVILKRPLAKVNIGSDEPENYSEYTHVTVERFNIPNNYNILTKTSDVATTQEIRLEKTAMLDAEAGQWTYFFVFAPVDKAEYTLNIPVTINNEAGSLEDKSATVSVIPVDDNMESDINFTPEGGSGEEPEPEPGNDMQINVGFDNDYEEPADPNALNVGDYIDATGAKVADASSAVAIVFALADGVTDDSEYGEGKVAEAYAVSLTFATSGRTYATNYYSMNLASTAEGSYAGYAFTQAIDEARQDGTDYRQLDNFFNSNQAPALSGDKVSGWYIPSLAQLQAVANVSDATLTATLQGGHTGDYSLATSSVVTYTATSEQRLQGVVVTQATGVLENNNTIQESTSFHILPVVTIFE